jgi:radical SAM superfamily enzyme YgiQ (UPF0313 family)
MRSYRHILMVYPEFPVTYWGMQYTLTLLGKKAAMPPLGLITIAAMTPPEYEFRLVDLNCRPLTEEDLAWADMVCFSAMLTQKKSLFEVAKRCRKAGKLVVFGGPFPTSCSGECAPHCDVLVLNEGEVTWPLFLFDLEHGSYQALYTSDEKPDITHTPVPRFDLLKIDEYLMIPIQFSRGCPFLCEFCDVIVLFGRKARAKIPEQVCAELEALERTGFRGSVFIDDDNFIGNKREVRKLLPRLREWNEAHNMPFSYGTEASINLADDPALLQDMVSAAFRWVFIGIETPSVESLKETLKFQNTKRSLVGSVRTIQDAGLFVDAGFVVGFDNDPEDIFDRQIEFINEAAIACAAVVLLVALPGTPLFSRLRDAGRLKTQVIEPVGNNYGYTNIVTILPPDKLLAGYRRVMATIYTPTAFFSRAGKSLLRLPRPASLRGRIRYFLDLHKYNGSLGRQHGSLRAQLAIAYRVLTTLPREFKREAFQFILSILAKRPELLPAALRVAFLGAHMCQFTAQRVLPQLDAELERLTADHAADSMHRAAPPVDLVSITAQPMAGTSRSR